MILQLIKTLEKYLEKIKNNSDLGSTESNPSFTDIVDKSGRNLGKVRLMDSANTLIDPTKEQTLQNLALNLINLNKNRFPFTPIDDLKFSGSYASGTFTLNYTPNNGDLIYIDKIVLSTYLGKGELNLYYGSSIEAYTSASERRIYTTVCPVNKVIVGDGTTQFTLQLTTYSSGTYFGKAIMNKVTVNEL